MRILSFGGGFQISDKMHSGINQATVSQDVPLTGPANVILNIIALLSCLKQLGVSLKHLNQGPEIWNEKQAIKWD